MSAILSPTEEADGIPAGSTMPAQQIVSCGDLPRDSVSDGLRDLSRREIEDRLDAAIREMGDKADEAMRQGDPTGARIWRERRDIAAACRSPEHKAREREAAKRYMRNLDEAEALGGCFFEAMGQVLAKDNIG